MTEHHLPHPSGVHANEAGLGCAGVFHNTAQYFSVLSDIVVVIFFNFIFNMAPLSLHWRSFPRTGMDPRRK